MCFYSWLEGLFNEADRNRNGLLCEREVHQLLLKLNVRLTQEEFDQYFEVKNFQDERTLFHRIRLEKRFDHGKTSTTITRR